MSHLPRPRPFLVPISSVIVLSQLCFTQYNDYMQFSFDLLLKLSTLLLLLRFSDCTIAFYYSSTGILIYYPWLPAHNIIGISYNPLNKYMLKIYKDQ